MTITSAKLPVVRISLSCEDFLEKIDHSVVMTSLYAPPADVTSAFVSLKFIRQ